MTSDGVVTSLTVLLPAVPMLKEKQQVEIHPQLKQKIPKATQDPRIRIFSKNNLKNVGEQF